MGPLRALSLSGICVKAAHRGSPTFSPVTPMALHHLTTGSWKNVPGHTNQTQVGKSETELRWFLLATPQSIAPQTSQQGQVNPSSPAMVQTPEG